VYTNKKFKFPSSTMENGEWGKPHNEELHELCSSPNIIRIIKARRMRSEGHVA
jgi:hypothetical protein